MSTQLYIVEVDTESGDHYSWVVDFKPSKDFMCKHIKAWEGDCESLQFYRDTLSVRVKECSVKSEQDFKIEN